jgi:hypothetical protein
MNPDPKCPKCGNTTFRVSRISLVNHENYDVVICAADDCGTVITPYIPMAHTFLVEIKVKLDELAKKMNPAP